MSTGVPTIDTQHKELIAATNEIGDAIEKENWANAIKKLLVFLKFYAEWHFGNEETCAAKHHCPMAGVNQEAHKKFIDTFGKLHDRYCQSDASDEIAHKIYDELCEWLVSHILRIDTQIGACIKDSLAKQA
ncbi:MAG: hemerythrin [Pseudanabaena frigida]|uniref:Hemerythrin n=1 Tax=Pseudanabaena frigida TaxID=945775 RepID=A0A2W4WJL6_9CYAN|nr:MAG: hemerythrin [Pseudanabaena frigida]